MISERNMILETWAKRTLGNTITAWSLASFEICLGLRLVMFFVGRLGWWRLPCRLIVQR
jgi:hypothetical protein